MTTQRPGRGSTSRPRTTSPDAPPRPRIVDSSSVEGEAGPAAGRERASTTVPSPLGPVEVVATKEALVAVRLPGSRPAAARGAKDGGSSTGGATDVLRRASEELAAYFRGELRGFSVPIALSGTPFEEEVWRGLLAIPYGERRSYKWLAERIGRPTAFRAVGAANGRNRLPIVVPCHRVIGADGSLTGYGGGLAAKRWLLEHEAAQEELFPSR